MTVRGVKRVHESTGYWGRVLANLHTHGRSLEDLARFPSCVRTLRADDLVSIVRAQLVEARHVEVQLGLLDEGCQTGSGKDSSVLENLHTTFSQPKYKSYVKPKKASDKTFCVDHYAGEVVYAIEGFVEKNKDELSPDITACLEVRARAAAAPRASPRRARRRAARAAARRHVPTVAPSLVGRCTPASSSSRRSRKRTRRRRRTPRRPRRSRGAPAGRAAG